MEEQKDKKDKKGQKRQTIIQQDQQSLYSIDADCDIVYDDTFDNGLL